jgi:hypothetical protein
MKHQQMLNYIKWAVEDFIIRQEAGCKVQVGMGLPGQGQTIRLKIVFFPVMLSFDTMESVYTTQISYLSNEGPCRICRASGTQSHCFLPLVGVPLRNTKLEEQLSTDASEINDDYIRLCMSRRREGKKPKHMLPANRTRLKEAWSNGHTPAAGGKNPLFDLFRLTTNGEFANILNMFLKNDYVSPYLHNLSGDADGFDEDDDDDGESGDHRTVKAKDILTLFTASVPDYLHTVFKGIVVDMIGISLQLVIMTSKIDPQFRRTLSLIDIRMKSFPTGNSAHPTRPYAWIHGISGFIKSLSLEQLFSSNNIINTAGTETWKLPCMLKKLTFAIGPDILSPDRNWLTKHGFPHSKGSKMNKPFTETVSVHELVVTALASVLEYMYCLNSKLKTATDIDLLEYLNNVCRAHYARLFHVRNRLQYVVDEVKKSAFDKGGRRYDASLALFKDILQRNAKHHLTVHQKMFMLLFGGDTRHTDTELGEALHKLVALLPYLRCNRSQLYASSDMMKWLMSQRLIAYNAQKYGLAPERKISAIPGPLADGEPMAFVVSRSTSVQHLVWCADEESGRPLLCRLADGHKNSVGLSFAHARIGEKNFFQFLNKESNWSKIPTEVDSICLVTQIKCLGDHKPHGVPEFQVNACPPRVANVRRGLMAEQKVGQYNFVLVAYEDDDTGDEHTEVAMVVAIINYELKKTGTPDTRFVIAWMRDAVYSRDIPSPCPYPVKQFIVTKEGQGGAVRGGNRWHLDIIEPGQIREPVFLAKQLVGDFDLSMDFPNGTQSWDVIAAQRYYYISHSRITSSYDLEARFFKMSYKKVFFLDSYFPLLDAILSEPLPTYVKPRSFAVKRDGEKKRAKKTK